MMKAIRLLTVMLAVVVLTISMGSAANAQSNSALSADLAASKALAAQNGDVAEALLAAREAAMGRGLEANYRASLKDALSLLPAGQLQGLGGDADLRDVIGTSALGDSRADLVYTPVTPCRIIDTRNAGGVLAAGSTRSFYVAAGNYSTQGGLAGSCGIPFGPATAAVINFVAVEPAAPGDLRVTPYAATMPLASFLNYAAVPGLNIANGLAVTMCNPATTTCTRDITIQADAAATHVVADVQGYFSKVSIPVGSDSISSLVLAVGAQYTFGTTSVSLPNGGTCLVTCEVDVEQAVTTGPLFFNAARHAVVAGTNEAATGWGNDLVYPSQRTSASATRAFSMPANTAYNFGCWMTTGSGGDFVGKSAYTTASWICR